MDITHQMLEAARTEEWDALITLEAGRRELLNEFFNSSATPDELPLLTKGAEQLMALDKDIIEISQKQRDTIGAELQAIGQNKKANKAYTANS